ncbi:ATP-binding protein [Streptomyces sp. NPDC058357]|uniref:ATP-binding protein n=1 Tax=unclassified Streptomyces TaxID=2593676 RepID=UPI00365B5EA2
MMCPQAPYRPENVRFFDQLSLAPVHSAASVSRRFLRLALSKWQAASIEDDALLIGSELVTNAVAATGMLAEDLAWAELGELNVCHMRLVGLEDSVVIEAWDASDELPTLKHVGDDAEHGRGLLLVQQLAKRWGFYRVEGGKVAWAELEVRPPRSTALPERRNSGRPAVGPVIQPGIADLPRVLTGLERV